VKTKKNNDIPKGLAEKKGAAGCRRLGGDGGSIILHSLGHNRTSRCGKGRGANNPFRLENIRREKEIDSEERTPIGTTRRKGGRDITAGIEAGTTPKHRKPLIELSRLGQLGVGVVKAKKLPGWEPTGRTGRARRQICSGERTIIDRQRTSFDTKNSTKNQNLEPRKRRFTT